jgi:hypothetical protein
MNGIMQTAASTRWAGFHGLLGHIDFVGNKKKYDPTANTCAAASSQQSVQ